MITLEQYSQLHKKIGQGTSFTPEEEQDFREYECMLTDRKYGKEHTEGEIGGHIFPAKNTP